MLYSTQFGEKRIRVFNICIPVAKNLNAYFKSSDVEALSHFIIKKEISRVPIKGPKVVRENTISELVNLLHSYRHNCANQSSPSQLILPDSLKLLPLNILSVLKSPALKLLHNTKLDDKIYLMSRYMGMGLNMIPYYFYPRIYRITDIGENVSILRSIN